jgi:hypothetical protein
MLDAPDLLSPMTKRRFEGVCATLDDFLLR